MAKIRKSEKVRINSKENIKKINSNSILTSFINDLEVAESISYKNLVLYPVFRQTLKKVGLKTLAEALKENIVEIKETGVVKEIEIVNKSKDNKILIMEGDIVKGGAQNRVINVSMILDEDSTIRVPTTCIQQNRWNTFDAPFKSMSSASPSIGASLSKSVGNMMCESRGHSLYSANQRDIWETVNCYMATSGGDMKTKDYASAYDAKKNEIEEYKKAFKGKFPFKDESLVGVIISVGEILKADICADNEMFMLHVNNLLEGCFLDAVNVEKKTRDFETKQIIEFLNLIISADCSEFDTPNKNGKNLIFKGNTVRGNALIYDKDVIHLIAFGE